MSEPHRNGYEAVFLEPGALTAALSWYRAVVPGAVSMERRESIEQPVLLIYGRNDIAAYVNSTVQARLEEYVSEDFESVALEAGHWLIQDEEEAVVLALMEHPECVRSL